MQELLSNLAEALRPAEASDFRQAAPEVKEPASVAATQKDAAEQTSAAEGSVQAGEPDKEAGSVSAAKEGSDSVQSQQKPQAEMRSAPSAAEKLEQEIATTAEQVFDTFTEYWCRATSAGAFRHSQLVSDKRMM